MQRRPDESGKAAEWFGESPGIAGSSDLNDAITGEGSGVTGI
jgi:hypothetical protein